MNLKLLINLSAVAAGVIASIVYSNNRARKTEERFLRAVDDAAEKLSGEIEVDIPEDMVNRALQIAIVRDSEKFVKQAVAAIQKETTNNLETEIKTEVNKAYSDVKSQIREKLNAAVGKVDISEVRKEVVADAKYEAAKRLRSDMDDILNDYKKSVEKAKEELEDTLSDCKGSIEDSKDEMIEKLKEDMDGILKDYNKNLRNVADIYESINKTLARG